MLENQNGMKIIDLSFCFRPKSEVYFALCVFKKNQILIVYMDRSKLEEQILEQFLCMICEKIYGNERKI